MQHPEVHIKLGVETRAKSWKLYLDDLPSSPRQGKALLILQQVEPETPIGEIMPVNQSVVVPMKMPDGYPLSDFMAEIKKIATGGRAMEPRRRSLENFWRKPTARSPRREHGRPRHESATAGSHAKPFSRKAITTGSKLRSRIDQHRRSQQYPRHYRAERPPQSGRIGPGHVAGLRRRT